jgi:iron complex transport system permease protein
LPVCSAAQCPVTANDDIAYGTSFRFAWWLSCTAVRRGFPAYGLVTFGTPSRREWLDALVAPDIDDARQMFFHYSALPRFTVSLLAGAILGLSASLLQHALQNQLAEPATLGIASTAHLALAVAALWFSFEGYREPIALIGSIAAGIAVLGISGRKMSSTSVLLAGLVVNFFCSSVSSVLTIFNFEYLTSLFLWGAGSLVQNDWSASVSLAPRLLIGWVLSLALARPLALLQLGEEAATSLGSSGTLTRVLSLALAIALSATVVSVVGIIGFVGLAGALAARATTSTVKGHLIVAPLWGAALLCCTDQAIQALAGARGERFPTGVATAALGGLLLLLMNLRRRSDTADIREPAAETGTTINTPPNLLFVLALVFVAFFAAISVGRGENGWLWSLGDDGFTWQLRAPRVLVALSAGAMLAAAGMLIQRLSNNPLAGPEVMGVSSGAALGALFAAFLPVGATRGMQLALASAGAASVLLAMLVMAKRHSFSPHRLLLIGISLGAIVSAVVSVMVVAGDPRAVSALSWLAGSTYRVTMQESLVVFLCAVGLLGPIPWLTRWLDLLPLGKTVSTALGMPPSSARMVLLALAAALCAVATVVVGPLTFVGTMAPHLARSLGMRRPLSQFLAAIVIGATLMVIADWLGRNILFPWEVPGGLLAALVAGPYFIWRLHRR